MNAAVELLLQLADRVAARRRPRRDYDYREWIVSHPMLCPYRLSFRAWTGGGLSLVITDAQGGRILPPKKSQSMVFTQEQHAQLIEILRASRGKPWWGS